MRAMLIDDFGGPEVFHEGEIDKPGPRPGHVVLRVAASSVNPIDLKIRSGQVPPVAPELPAVLHGDVAGEVVSVGAGVDRFNVGDRVYGCAGGVVGLPGALAEYMRCDADLLAKAPRSLSLEDAACLPLVCITAWEMLDRAGIDDGHDGPVLVQGGAGGVGHVLTQLAALRGLTVHATASSRQKQEIAREYGARRVIPYREQSVEDYVAEHTGGTGYGTVFDTAGGEALGASLRALAPGGQVISIAARSTQDLSPLQATAGSLHVVLMLRPMLSGEGRRLHGEILAAVADLVDTGRLEPVIDERRFGFAEVAQAHARMEAGEHLGKIALIGF